MKSSLRCLPNLYNQRIDEMAFVYTQEGHLLHHDIYITSTPAAPDRVKEMSWVDELGVGVIPSVV